MTKELFKSNSSRRKKDRPEVQRMETIYERKESHHSHILPELFRSYRAPADVRADTICSASLGPSMRPVRHSLVDWHAYVLAAGIGESWRLPRISREDERKLQCADAVWAEIGWKTTPPASKFP
jgi:hypothetical protein